MVALQILVLSVWVRVLVRQQKKKETLKSLFFVRTGSHPEVLSPNGHDYCTSGAIFESWFFALKGTITSATEKKETLKSLFFVRTGSHPEVLSPNGHDYCTSGAIFESWFFALKGTITSATEKKETLKSLFLCEPALPRGS